MGEKLSPLSFIQMHALAGRARVGDVGVASGALAVGGGITAATAASAGGNSTTVSVSFSDRGTTNYTVAVAIEGHGARDDDNDLEHPIVLNRTSTGFDVYLFETNPVAQDVSIHVMVFTDLGS